MKEKLKVGDRVRVYGWVQMHHQPYQPRGGGDATVVWVSEISGDVHVQFDKASNGMPGEDPTHYSIQPKQCRRLVKRKRREWFVAIDGGGADDIHTFDGRTLFKSIPEHLKHYNWVRLREVRK